MLVYRIIKVFILGRTFSTVQERAQVEKLDYWDKLGQIMIPLFPIIVLIFADFGKDGTIFRVINLTGKRKTFSF